MEQVIKERIIGYIEALEQEQAAVDRDLMIKQMKADRDDWTGKVFQFIQKQQFDYAYQMFNKILFGEDGQVNRYWLDTNAAILDFMFRLYLREKENGTKTIFQMISSLDEMNDIYFELKFLLRRFEYDLPEMLKEQLCDFLNRYPISSYAIIEMVNVGITRKEKVLNEVAVFLLKKGRYEYVLPLLSDAYDKESDNRETIYNLSYFLYAVGEAEAALEFMEIKSGWEEISKLKNIVQGGQKLPAYDLLHKMVWNKQEEVPDVLRPDNQEKISFIMCVNDDRLYQECCYYIDNLLVPEGYIVEKIPIFGADSMSSGYQKGMLCTDAKYKVFLHQDAFCTDRNFLYEAIHLFEQDSEIGMLGVAGSKDMSESGVWWEAEAGKYYNLYQDSVASYGSGDCWKEPLAYDSRDYQEVQVIDGVFMMTSKDVDWREDLFDGWHFYDMSQSMEFWRRGYKVVIPRPRELWILHCGKCGDELDNSYRSSRITFLKEYRQDIILKAEKKQKDSDK